MKFKKIYVEITNKCNLNCSFCSKLEREYKDMTIDEFKYVISEIKDYTKYIYLHVKGEPLAHPYFKDIVEIAEANDIKINITTNGTNIPNVLSVLKNSKAIRQINISLHALEAILKKEEYLDKIIEIIKVVEESNFYLSLRIWIDNEEVNNLIKEYLKEKLNAENLDNIGKGIFWSYDSEFEWPTLENEIVSYTGKCLGTKTHVAILANGDVVPCCLDANGVIKLGNIFETKFSDIINGERFNNMTKGFNNNKLVEELCQKCKYRRK